MSALNISFSTPFTHLAIITPSTVLGTPPPSATAQDLRDDLLRQMFSCLISQPQPIVAVTPPDQASQQQQIFGP